MAKPISSTPISFCTIATTILETNIEQKCESAIRIFEEAKLEKADHKEAVQEILTPGLPKNLILVAPRELKKRGIQSQQGRNILMHAIAHIEFNAINLALDAAYRFRSQPADYYRDWLSVAADEARHFKMTQNYLLENGDAYGNHPAHNGLWEMAVKTSNDIVARMALVPRVMEARGLDVTPAMIRRFERVGDQHAVEILNTIYQEEIRHVAIGSKWFKHHCALNDLEPRSTFVELINTHLHGELRGPFNYAARLQSGFDRAEIEAFEK